MGYLFTNRCEVVLQENRKMKKIIQEAIDILQESDRLLCNSTVKTCQIKDREKRKLVNDHIYKARLNIQDAIDDLVDNEDLELYTIC